MEDKSAQDEGAIEILQVIDDDDDSDQETSQQSTVLTVEEDDPIMTDIGNKMAITYHVLKSCIEEKIGNIYNHIDNPILKMAYLTNMPKNILSQVVNKGKKFETTNVLSKSVLETPDIDLLIRQTLVEYYVKLHKIPTSESLSHITNNHPYNYQLHEQLRRSGYIWRRLGNTKRAIIVEHPQRVIEKQRFLQKIINYRKEKRSIVYVETKILTRADSNISLYRKFFSESVNYIVLLIAVDNNKGYLDDYVSFCKSIYDCQKLIENNIIKYIVPKLSDHSVIILENKPFYSKSCPVPTIESEKSEMIFWLNYNGIPQLDVYHRSELFEMIQKCKNKRGLHKFDAILFSHGHEILRRPNRTNYLNYYKPLWDDTPLTKEIATSIGIRGFEYWKNLESTLIKMEKTVLNEDLELDNITDKILTMANNTDVGDLAEAECDEEVDGLIQEEFLLEIKNSFSAEELQVRDQEFLLDINKFEDKVAQSSTSMK